MLEVQTEAGFRQSRPQIPKFPHIKNPGYTIGHCCAPLFLSYRQRQKTPTFYASFMWST